MVQAGVTADAALQMIVDVSQLSNVPLRIVAQKLVNSLPGVANSPPNPAGETLMLRKK